MLELSAQLLTIATSSRTNNSTGEIVQRHVANCLDIDDRGNAEIIKLALDPSIVSQWEKIIGKSFRNVVRPWAFKDDRGEVQSGLSLGSKKDLPNVIATPGGK